ncbi:MAG TPA: DUF4398 domain-containing protein [Woeseiaceae bacterium]|nr:DUF4398 domain-containing protein [Woeseiaceae bacterium]
MISKRRTSAGPLAVLFAGLALSACETAPPVQEMSDARQAIEVARQAGAASHARPELTEALQYLEEAENELDIEDYARARRSALQAKSKALEARALSEASHPR